MKACRIDGLPEDLNVDLTAMRVTRQHQIITLPGRERKYVRVMGEQQVKRAGLQKPFGALQISMPAVRGFVIDAGHVQARIAKAKARGLASQEPDADSSGFGFGGRLHTGVMLVIAHATENTGIGLEARQLADAGIKRVAARGDQVTRYKRDMGVQAEGGIDHSGQFLLAQKRAQVDVADL